MPAWKEIDQPDPIGREGQDLADFVVGLRYEDVPPAVVHQAQRVLLEALSWPFLGSRRPEGRRLHRYLDDAPRGPCSVATRADGVAAPWAAFANGSLSQVQDCNDGQRVASVYGGAYHPGRLIVPAALAVCQAERRSGRELLVALVAGYDVAARIRGLEPRPPAAVYAAAAAAARLGGLDPNQTLHCMGVAGHLASPIPDETPFDVSFLTVGNNARLAVEAAGLARRGFTGPPLRDDARLSMRLAGDGLGERFHITEIYMKPHLGCRLLHGAVEAGLAYRDQFDWRDIAHVRVRVVSEAHYVTARAGPRAYYRTCQLSLPYCLAAALIDGELEEAQFTEKRIGSDDIQAMQQRIQVVTDESLGVGYPLRGRATVVEIATSNGIRRRWENRFDLGEPENALTDEQLVDKFHRWAGPSFASGASDRLVEEIFSLDVSDDAAVLFDLITGRE